MAMMILLLLSGQLAAQVPVIDSICPGAVRYYRVDGEPGSTYAWNLTDPFGALTPLPSDADTVEVAWNFDPGIYELRVVQTSIDGCVDEAVLGLIKIFAPPEALAGPDAEICETESYLLAGATAINYGSVLWSSGGDGTFDDNTILNATYTPGQNDIIAGSVSLTLTAFGQGDEGTCDPSSSSMTLILITQTVPEFDPIGPLCHLSDPPELPSTSINGITGTWDPPVISTATTGSTDYTFTPDAGQCAKLQSLSIIITPLPDVYAGADQFIPNGTAAFIGDATASGSAPLSYSWQPAALLLDPTLLTPTTVGLFATTTFTLTVTDVYGCVSTDEVTIFITGGPLAVNPIAFPQTICQGETTQLFANASGGSGLFTYKWTSDPPGFTSTLANPVASPLVTTTYYVDVTDENTTVTGSVTVTVYPVPDVYAGGDRTIPYGTNITILDATASGFEPLTYSWAPADSLLNPTVLNPTTINLQGTTTFTLTVTDGHGCQASDTITITITGGPLTANPVAVPEEICFGGTSVLFSNAGGGSGVYNYYWTSEPPGFSSNDPNPVVSPTVTTIYYLTVYDGFNTVEDSVVVTVHDLPLVYAGADQLIAPMSAATIGDATAAGAEPLTYSWTPAFLLTNPTALHPTTIPLSNTTTFTLTVTDANGCQNSDEVTIVITLGPLTVDPEAIPDEICLNDFTQLFANPGGGSGTYTFLWTSSPPGFSTTEENPVVAPTQSTLYHIELSDGFSTVNGSVNVTVHPLPEVNCPDDLSLCLDNGPVALSGGTPAGGTYSGIGVIDGIFYPLASGAGIWPVTYVYTSPNNCTDSCTFNITVNALPDVYAGADQVILPGTSASITDATASGTMPLTYSWTPAGLLLDPTVLNPITVNLLATTTFTLTVTDANGCDSLDQVVIIVEGEDLAVNPDAVPDAICSGDTAMLYAHASGGTGNYTYSWTSDPSGFTSTEADPLVTPAVTTTYTVTVDDGLNTASGTVTVTVHPLPVVTCPPDLLVCIDFDPVVLSGATPAGGTYSGTGVSNGIFDPSVAGIGTWEITYVYTSIHGCTDTCTFNFIVADLPVVTCPADTAVCEDSPAFELTGGVPAGGIYSGEGVYLENGSYYFDPTIGTDTFEITYTYSDSNHCEGTCLFTVTVSPNPVVTAVIATDETFGLGNGSIEIIASGITEHLFYSISGGGFWQTDNGLFEGLAAGVYSCVVMDENGCDTTFTVTLDNVMLIELEALTGPGNQCLGFAAVVPIEVNHFISVASFQLKLKYNVDQLLCEGYIDVHPQLADHLTGWIDQPNGEITLEWEGDQALTFNQLEIVASLVFTPKQPGQAQLEWYTGETESFFINEAGVQIPAIFTIGVLNIYDPPVILMAPDLNVCEGQQVSITGIAHTTQPPVIYEWIYPNGQTYPIGPTFDSITKANAGLYTLIATDAMYCKDIESMMVVVSENPVAAFHGMDTLVVAPGYILSAGTGLASYLWNTGETTESIEITGEGWYWVEMLSQADCWGLDSVYIKLEPPECMFIPNAFTPNGDGLNDTFKPVSICPITSFKMVIYNRWGEKLYETNDISSGWDGTKNGVQCPGDAYVFMITYKTLEENGVEERHLSYGVLILLK